MANAAEIMIGRMCDCAAQALARRGYHVNLGQLGDSTFGMVTIPRRLTPAQIHELNQLLLRTVRKFMEDTAGEKPAFVQEASGAAVISADGKHIVEAEKGEAFPPWRERPSGG